MNCGYHHICYYSDLYILMIISTDELELNTTLLWFPNHEHNKMYLSRMCYYDDVIAYAIISRDDPG